MGFHKRWVNKEQILSRYKTLGIQGVIDWIRNADAIVSEDTFSMNFLDSMTDNQATTTDSGYSRFLSGILDREMISDESIKAS